MRKYVLMVTVVLALMVSAVFGQNAGVEWTLVKNSPFGGSQVNAIVWGKDKFVAVGDKGKIAYSLDGVTWTAVKNSTFNNKSDINAVAWGKDKFVAGGKNNDYGKFAYSSDGITWTEVRNDALFRNYEISNIIWGNNKFVATTVYFQDCDDYESVGMVAYSSDGITWVKTEYGEYGGHIAHFVWCNNKFVVASTSSYGEGSAIYYSSDGITWNRVENYPLNGSTGAFACIDNKFVAVGYHLFDTDEMYDEEGNCIRKTEEGHCIGYEERVMYSLDGITWKEVKNKVFNKYSISINAWGNDKLVVAENDYTEKNSSSKMAYSSDGIIWTLAKNYPFGKSKTNKIVYGNGVFVASSWDGKIAYSK